MLNYPAWLNFDVDHVGEFTSQQLTKIGLVSVPVSRYSKWDGTGNLYQESINRLNSIIDSAHAAGKRSAFGIRRITRFAGRN